MGGRGASSGISKKGNKYGTQYKTLFQVGNIKFVTKKTRDSEPLMETMTKGRVYVTVGGDELKSITYFDNKNKRKKVIDLNHKHLNTVPHVHDGYLHNEDNGAKGSRNLTKEERKLFDRVTKIWQNRNK